MQMGNEIDGLPNLLELKIQLEKEVLTTNFFIKLTNFLQIGLK